MRRVVFAPSLHAMRPRILRVLSLTALDLLPYHLSNAAKTLLRFTV